MRGTFIIKLFLKAALITAGGLGVAHGEARHGIAMYGEPALPADFTALPYVNPDAPKGGRIVTGEVGIFDSLNPHIRKGRVPWQLRFLSYESLMGRSYDEPFTLYALLAETIEVGPNREWVEFSLNPAARFSDGSPVTVDDVLWSFETLGTKGHPRYLGAWTKVATSEITGPRRIRFTFKAPDPELPLILALRPILKKSQWQDIEFTESRLDVVPIGSAPYVVADFDPGRHVTLRRNPDYWGKDLPFRRGTHNLDEIRMEFFGDGNIMFEAFKAGVITSNRETSLTMWDEQYDFPSIASGDVVKSLIPHRRPSGIRGFAMNTRRAVFADIRVRDALFHLFNYEAINAIMNGGDLPRISSYFSNSELGMRAGPAQGMVRDLLAAQPGPLPVGALEGYALPVSDGTLRNRRNLRRALALLQEAGWQIDDAGQLRNAAGRQMQFEILLKQSWRDHTRAATIFVDALKRAGIRATIAHVDDAQFKERSDTFDFDMTFYERGLSLSPGNEQKVYWGSDAAGLSGSRNWMGIESAAVDGLIETMLHARDRSEYTHAVRGLDRVLTAGRYVIPIWYQPHARIAHVKELRYPETIPAYGDFLGFQPDIWWYEK